MNAEADLQQLVAYLFSAIEEERGKAAQILHNEVGQALTVAKMELHSARRRISSDTTGIEQQLSSIADVIDEAMRTVRRLSADLRPGVLTDLGLEAAAEWYIERLATETGIRCRLITDIDEQRMGAAQITAAFRILQEVLQYITTQMRVTSVVVKITTDEQQLTIHIEEDIKSRDAIDGNEGWVGELPMLLTLSIHERARMVGGRAIVHRMPREGARIIYILPHPATEGRRHDQGPDWG